MVSVSIKEPTQNEEELLKKHIRLVHYLVRKLNLSYEYDELVQVGTLGLLKAIRTFDETKAAFATYASRCVTNQLLMYHRRQGKHIPVLSLDRELTNDNGDNFSRYDVLEAAASDETGAVETKIILQQSIKKLSPKELEIIQFRLSGKEQKEIGQLLNISQSYVSRIEKRALKKLARHLEPYKGDGIMGRGTGRNVRVGPRQSIEEPVPSPVTTYTLPLEELERYRNQTLEGGLNMGARKTRLDIAREKLTQEVYLRLRSQGLKDAEIIKQLNIAVDVFYKIKKEFALDKLAQPDKPVQPPTQIVWVDKRTSAAYSSEPVVIIGRRFTLNVAARRLIVADGVKIGVLGENIVLAPCDGDDCYKLSGNKGATIGGNGLLKSLLELGLTEGTYQLTKDQNGYLVGCKDTCDANTL